MKKMTVGFGIFTAILFAVFGPLSFAIAYTLVPVAGFGLKFATALGVFVYACLLASQAERRKGRLFLLLSLLFFEGIGFILFSFPVFSVMNLFALWGIRVLLFATGPLEALVEGLLIGVAVPVGLAAIGLSGSLTLGVWSFLLVLASAPVVHELIGERRADAGSSLGASMSRFDSAYRSAEQAIGSMSRI